MLRFAKNRWWAFILALSVLLASSATFSSRSYGDGNEPIVIPGGAPDAPPAGDPDAPAGKRTAGSGRAVPGGSRPAVTSMGDGVSAQNVWVWRLHVVLRSLIIRYSR
jgi:hypothetical protein